MIVNPAEAGLTHVPRAHVAVYIEVATGETVIEAPVCPFDQVTVPLDPAAVNTVL